MTLQQNISLKPFNSFGIDAAASHFAAFSSVDELMQLLSLRYLPAPFILGGGSNILLTTDINRFVLKNELKGIEIIQETASDVYVRVQAGENWHAFVCFCVNKGFGGIENLSLIPGNAGASPMQNIGAYGVEIKDVFHQLEAWHIRDQCMVRFSAADCAFGYRESVFKNRYKNQFVILNVTFRLNKQPVFNTSYGAIEAELEKMGVQELSVRTISQAVINIRSSKLPDPKETGNAGSFFKNPVIGSSIFERLKKEHPSIPGYPGTDGSVKVAAGWLIEQCGWKGYRRGDAGCYPKQALVLVNYGNASGAEIYALSQDIIDSVHNRFGISLEREVNIIT